MMDMKDRHTPKGLRPHLFSHPLQTDVSDAEWDSVLANLDSPQSAPVDAADGALLRERPPKIPRSAIDDAFREELERYNRKEGIYSPALGDPLPRFVQICGVWGLLDSGLPQPAAGSLASGPDANPCTCFEDLLARERPLSDREIEELLAHEESCTSGRHDRESLERDLGLSEGALHQGSPEHGLLSQKERLNRLRSYVKIVIEEEQLEETSALSEAEPLKSRRTLSEELDRLMSSISLKPAKASGRRSPSLSSSRKGQRGSLAMPLDFPVRAERSSLALAPLTEPPAAPAPVRAFTGRELASLSPIRGLFRQQGSVTWLSGMFRLDRSFTEANGYPPTCVVILWRLSPHWGPFLSFPAEEMVFLPLDGAIEWHDGATDRSIRLGGEGGKSLLWTASGDFGLSRERPALLPPFRARQAGNREAVGLAILYSSSGLRFETARDGRQIRFKTEEWPEEKIREERPRLRKVLGALADMHPFTDHIPADALELDALMSNAQAIRGDRHDPARRAGQFLDRDLPRWSSLKGIDTNLQVRLAKFYAGSARSEREILMAEHAGMEIIVPLLGGVELFCSDLNFLRGSRLEKTTWLLGDFEPDQRIRATASSAAALGEKFPGLLLLHSRYPHALQGLGTRSSICLHVRCLSQR